MFEIMNIRFFIIRSILAHKKDKSKKGIEIHKRRKAKFLLLQNPIILRIAH